jgi:hypothetical protein
MVISPSDAPQSAQRYSVTSPSGFSSTLSLPQSHEFSCDGAADGFQFMPLSSVRGVKTVSSSVRFHYPTADASLSLAVVWNAGRC